MFTGCGALVALLIFLPLPTRFKSSGTSASTAIAYAFYVVGTIALLVGIVCFFGLRNLPGEEGKGLHLLFGEKSKAKSDSGSAGVPLQSYPRLLWSSIQLGLQSQDIGLGYLGGFVARASSVAISLFIPLFTNAYFLRTGQCTADPDNPSDIKHACERAYKLAAALTGVSQLVALLCAPLFGYLSGRYPRFNIPLMLAAFAGIAGYSMFGSLASPDPRSQDGSGGVFVIVILLGISQMGAIVCSLALLSGTINHSETQDRASGGLDDSNDSSHSGDSAYYSVSTQAIAAARNLRDAHLQSNSALTPPGSRPMTPNSDEQRPLLPVLPSSRPDATPKSLSHLRGSIAGTYSLAGGAGILLLTKLGGYLFDSAGPGSPFYMMAAFNALLFVATLFIAAREGLVSWTSRDNDLAV
jgi:MFS family permease